MPRSSLLIAWSVLACAGFANAADAPPLVHQAVLNVPAQKVWEVFTTSDGFKNFGVALADIDLRLGGKIRSRYAADGVLGDPATIEQTILAYEPMRMIAFRTTKVPDGFPFPDAMARTWNVAYIDDLGNGRTRLTMKGFGYTDDEQSRQMRAFFDAGNAWSFETLRAGLEGTPPPTRPAHQPAQKDEAPSGQASVPEPALLSPATGDLPIIVEAVVPESQADAWRRWTTLQGLATFFGEKQNFELRPGGPFEIFFSMSAPEGQRGSEGCTVLSFDPPNMISFTWNAPPQLPAQRAERTWVVVSFTPESTADQPTTRIRLAHHGWAEHIAKDPDQADNWRKAHAYFSAAWPRVFSLHQEAVQASALAPSAPGASAPR